MVPERRAYADRVQKYAPPPWRIFDALVDEREKWLLVRDHEVDPDVLDAVRPSLVVWGSLWPVSPDDTIEFHLTPAVGGTAMRFTWYTASPPDDRGIGLVRQHLNTALGQDLREWVDTEVPLR
jgi:hypothetical protein